MIAIGTNAHLFAQPRRREELRRCFQDVLGVPVADVDYPGVPGPMLVARFPDGGSLSVEFRDDAPDDDVPRLGAWLELRADDPAALVARARAAGLPPVHHGGHPHYLAIPGGQVFAVAPAG